MGINRDFERMYSERQVEWKRLPCQSADASNVHAACSENIFKTDLPDHNGDFMITAVTVTKKRVWQFPVERFVTYEPSDELWCRPLGIGCEIEVTERHTIRARVRSISMKDGVTTLSGELIQ